MCVHCNFLHAPCYSGLHSRLYIRRRCLFPIGCHQKTPSTLFFTFWRPSFAVYRNAPFVMYSSNGEGEGSPGHPARVRFRPPTRCRSYPHLASSLGGLQRRNCARACVCKANLKDLSCYRVILIIVQFVFLPVGRQDKAWEISGGLLSPPLAADQTDGPCSQDYERPIRPRARVPKK